jgi:hypothetical protein
LFPLLSVQQACLAFDLVKGLCPLSSVLLVSSAFLIYNILTFDQKKERALSEKVERDALLPCAGFLISVTVHSLPSLA